MEMHAIIQLIWLKYENRHDAIIYPAGQKLLFDAVSRNLLSH